jgi:hypothetical protein
MTLLHDPLNPAVWLDGTPRSQRSGFAVGFGEPIQWQPLEHAQKMRHVSSRTVAKARADGSDHSTIHGISKKADELIRATAPPRPAPRRQPKPSGPSKAQRLREALAAGPMTSRELAAVTGIHMDLVPALLQWSVSIGQVTQARGCRQCRYALANAQVPA